MTDALDHERYLRRALELGSQVPRFPFGSVIVDRTDGTIVAEGWNPGGDNPIWHGEIDAITRCAQSSPGIDWTRLALYTTSESCSMCSSAILWAGIGLVVFGTSLATLRRQGWQINDIDAEEVIRRTPFRRCELIGGVLEAACDALFAAALRLQRE